jgi:anthranilate synthase component 1
LDELENALRQPIPAEPQTGTAVTTSELTSLVPQAVYEDMVRAAKEHIAAGDIFQVVLSQHMLQETQASPFAIYRALRRLNPSPYMFFFDFADLAGDDSLFLIGASPELNVRLEEGKATIRPIAGTRPRGNSPAMDKKLETELLADPKELAEHVMLVDLARNDLGRVCQYGSVRVSEQMNIERYSHVMHIVSQVEGELSPELDAFDLVRATFPAGTVSGAPKIRAMQIIHDLEKHARGPYAGAIGYFSYDGSMDTCIAIRTLVMRGNVLRFQAGAGIVADSDPQREYIETMNKARALEVAVRMAEEEIGRAR